LSIQRDNLLKRVTNVIAKSANSVWYQILGGVGVALDQVDPAQIQLADQFSVTTATGSALDKHGADWGVPRRYNESDESYRQRILAQLPRYASGPTVANIKAVVRAFTGVDPDIFEFGPDGFTMGYSTMGEFGFSAQNETFSFQVTVYNPNNVTYNQQDLIDAVNQAKPARSQAEFVFM
jgi:hypothetical protein